MVNAGKPAHLTPSHLHRLLEAYRKASPLPPSPLTTFLTIENQLTHSYAADLTPAVETAVIEWIIDEITTAYNDQRQILMLASVKPRCDRASASNDLIEDFKTQVEELAGWSVLYYRFVRVDLDLSWQEMAALGSVNTRTLRRRQNHGLNRLVSQLLSCEQKARQVAHKRHLKRSIPSDTTLNQVGLAASIDKVLGYIQGDSRRHVALVGPGGIGKTTLAILATRALVEQATFRRLVWLYIEQEMDCAGVLEVVQQHITPVQHQQKTLEQTLQRDETLIVLDEFEHLLRHGDQSGIAGMLERLSDASLLITSRQSFPHDSVIHTVELAELNDDEAVALMQAAWPAHRYLDAATQETIAYLAGGNPRAIVLSTRIVAQMPQAILQDGQAIPSHNQHEAMLKQLYGYAWDHLQDEARFVWLTAYLMPEKSISSDLVGYISGIEDAQLPKMLEQLGLLSLLYWDAESQSFSLQNVARHFLYIIAESGIYDDWFRMAIGRLCNVLWGRANAAVLVIHLMGLPQANLLDSNQRFTLFKTAWSSVNKNGLWQAWAVLLKKQWQNNDQWDAEAQQWLCYWLGVTHRWLADYDKAFWWFSEGLHIGDQCTESPTQILCLIELAVLHRHKGQLASAVATIQRATSMAQQQREGSVIERCTLESAQIALDSSRYQEAQKLLTKVAPSSRASMVLCDIKVAEKDYETALFHARQALKMASHDQPNLARVHASLGRVYIGLKSFERAEDHLSLAHALLTKYHDEQAIARVQTLLGQLDSLRGDHQNALHQLEDAAERLRELGDAVGLYHTLQILLDVYVKLAEQAIVMANMDAAHDLSVKMACVETEWQKIGDTRLE